MLTLAHEGVLGIFIVSVLAGAALCSSPKSGVYIAEHAVCFVLHTGKTFIKALLTLKV
jgi:hypothetical protein